jgi:hypothetical protein
MEGWSFSTKGTSVEKLKNVTRQAARASRGLRVYLLLNDLLAALGAKCTSLFATRNNK